MKAHRKTNITYFENPSAALYFCGMFFFSGFFNEYNFQNEHDFFFYNNFNVFNVNASSCNTSIKLFKKLKIIL